MYEQQQQQQIDLKLVFGCGYLTQLWLPTEEVIQSVAENHGTLSLFVMYHSVLGHCKLLSHLYTHLWKIRRSSFQACTTTNTPPPHTRI